MSDDRTATQAPVMTGQHIVDKMKDAVHGNISTITIEGQTWVRKHDGKLTIPNTARVVGPETIGAGMFDPRFHGVPLADTSQTARVVIWFETRKQAIEFCECLQKAE